MEGEIFCDGFKLEFGLLDQTEFEDAPRCLICSDVIVDDLFSIGGDGSILCLKDSCHIMYVHLRFWELANA